MDITQIGTVLAIVVITYLIGLAAKVIPGVKDELISVIVGVSGGILGVIGMYVIPDFPARSIKCYCSWHRIWTGVNRREPGVQTDRKGGIVNESKHYSK